MIEIGYLTKKSKSKASHVGFDASIGFKPNPANNSITIFGNVDKVVIEDATGKITLLKQVNIDKQLSIQHLAKGVYFVHLFTGNTKLNTKKLIKID